MTRACQLRLIADFARSLPAFVADFCPAPELGVYSYWSPGVPGRGPCCAFLAWSPASKTLDRRAMSEATNEQRERNGMDGWRSSDVVLPDRTLIVLIRKTMAGMSPFFQTPVAARFINADTWMEVRENGTLGSPIPTPFEWKLPKTRARKINGLATAHAKSPLAHRRAQRDVTAEKTS
jgi:hypothetical protein